MDNRPAPPPLSLIPKPLGTQIDDRARMGSFIEAAVAAFHAAFDGEAVELFGQDTNVHRVVQIRDASAEYDVVIVSLRFTVKARRSPLVLLAPAGEPLPQA